MFLLSVFQCQKSADKTTVSFNESIRPVLNAKCLGCHGGVKQLGEYSLLFQQEAYDTTASGIYGLVPGDPASSSVFQRITSTDPTLRMPLDHPPLDKESIVTFKQWIEEGAKWETHWSFIPPNPALSPPNKMDANWAKNGIDHFVGLKHQEKGLSPAPPSDKANLVRRVYLDLIGLPPSPEVVNTFLKDQSENAYEKLIDQIPDLSTFW